MDSSDHLWIVAIISLQLEDFISSVTPIQQHGIIKNRYISTDLWQAYGYWSAEPQGFYCPINFSKALSHVSHVYAHTFPPLVPPMFVVASSSFPF